MKPAPPAYAPDTGASPVEARNRLMLRARDTMDRAFHEELDVPGLARWVGMSEAHFIRTFKAVYGETPHRYLQRRRVERAMFALRTTGRCVTDVCFDVGFNSLGTFSRTFKEIVGMPPSSYRQRFKPVAVPSCFAMAWARPSSFGEALAGETLYSDASVDGDQQASQLEEQP